MSTFSRIFVFGIMAREIRTAIHTMYPRRLTVLAQIIGRSGYFCSAIVTRANSSSNVKTDFSFVMGRAPAGCMFVKDARTRGHHAAYSRR
jgi:hypothetical protein